MNRFVLNKAEMRDIEMLLKPLIQKYSSAEDAEFIRIALCKKILATPLEEIDKRGAANVLTLLTNDIPQLTHTLMILPVVLVQATIFVFGIAYIWLGLLGFSPSSGS